MRRCSPRSIRSPGPSTCAAPTCRERRSRWPLRWSHKDGTADLFVEGEKIGDDVRAHLGNGVRLHEREAFEAYLRIAVGQDSSRSIPNGRSPRSARRWKKAARAIFSAPRSRPSCRSAIKNEAEIAGHQAAQARDGAAVSRFLKWVEDEAPTGELDEMNAADKLEGLPRGHGDLKDLSLRHDFGATGPMARCPITRAPRESNLPFEPGTLYLVDSGGQYQDGTTDITRTVPIGEPTDEMRDRFTRVLQGHIAIATALFPKGTRGQPARQFRAAAIVGGGASIMPMAPATASAASCRSTKGRSASRRSGRASRAATSRCARA